MLALKNSSLASKATKRLLSPQILSSRFNSTSSKDSQEQLTWANFFDLRKKERRINIGSSAFTAFLGCNASWVYLSTLEIDPLQPIMGFDPLLVVSSALVASGFLGYLMGPVIGTQIFKLSNKKRLKSFEVKNKDFLRKVVANRVNPSSQSFSNPVPDYYGEKIGSIREYRQWLRDCHAYRRKAKEFL